MPIILIVEDGSNVPGANTYQTVAGVREYAANRGVELSADPDTVAAMIVKGMDYLETFGCQFVGLPTYADQELLWPRTGAVISGAPFPPNAIPKKLVQALGQLVIDVSNGVDLQPTLSASDYVTEETVGPITTKYADPIAAGISPVLTAVSSLLNPLFGECGKSLGIRTRRV